METEERTCCICGELLGEYGGLTDESLSDYCYSCYSCYDNTSYSYEEE